MNRAKSAIAISFFLTLAGSSRAWSPLVVTDDPLVRMPGTQPGTVFMDDAGGCIGCHGGYDSTIEPGHNWKGSMMAQASRDFIFWSCMTVSEQDSIWALGNPNAGDLCLRCHMPKGWLEGRSDPPNGEAMAGPDMDGVQCHFCHLMYDPFYKTTYDGTREGNDWLGYWDETNLSGTPSNVGATNTRADDVTESATAQKFNADPFFVAEEPFSADYRENASGQYFVSADKDRRRASFADPGAPHDFRYSRYHKSKYFCATCHDVSNPALANLSHQGTPPGVGAPELTTETDGASAYYHVERTFSEFMLSDFGLQGGAPGVGPYDPGTFNTSQPGNFIATCQDCHMRDLSGASCDDPLAVDRPTGSAEHPNSGLPLHDLTGGNAWVPWVLASTDPTSPNYDPYNETQLTQGYDAITLELSEGLGIDPQALLDGVDRAKANLQDAAAIADAVYGSASGILSFRVVNQTAHKLISGFPEGRRMILNIQAYDDLNNLIYEVNPYDDLVGTLKGLDSAYSPSSPQLGANEIHEDALIYETHPNSALTGEEQTFHFVLATGRHKDNRIPPRGFRIAEAPLRQSEPAWHGLYAPDYFTAEEYAGGYDQVEIALPSGADRIEIKLYYQTTSREYIEFLRNEIRGTGSLTLSSPTPSGEPAAYVIQSDPFFTRLRAWGDTIWNLWTHNKDVDGAKPFLMTSATLTNLTAPCAAPIPTLISATPSDRSVSLAWSDEHTADANIIGYRIYEDQSGSETFRIQTDQTAALEDGDLSNYQNYCYKVTSIYGECESAFSNVLCASPYNAEDPLMGDADHSGGADMSDAVAAQSSLLDPSICAYPMVTVGNDLALGIDDVMLIAQFSNAVRPASDLSGPAGGPFSIVKVSGDQSGDALSTLPTPVVSEIQATGTGFCVLRSGLELNVDTPDRRDVTLTNLTTFQTGTSIQTLVVDHATGQTQPVEITVGNTLADAVIRVGLSYRDPGGTPLGTTIINYTATVLDLY